MIKIFFTLAKAEECKKFLATTIFFVRIYISRLEEPLAGELDCWTVQGGEVPIDTLVLDFLENSRSDRTKMSLTNPPGREADGPEILLGKMGEQTRRERDGGESASAHDPPFRCRVPIFKNRLIFHDLLKC